MAGAGPVAAQRFDNAAGVAHAISMLWQRGDAGGVVALGADAGLDLEIEGLSFGHLGGRRAAAALRSLFRGGETVDVRSGPLNLVRGADDRAFIEMDWLYRPVGSMAVERTTIFVGLVREPAGWKVSQIRVFQ
jgi:hypothetical protein